jgi:hypothetical protein
VGTTGEANQERGPDQIQNFIFARELAEVYLLLDHLSGRSDKGLAGAFGDGAEKAGEDRIKEICEIAWPPRGTSAERATQAATLLTARDRLNAAAKPANGQSIAFTVLVVGEQNRSWLAGAIQYTRAGPRDEAATAVRPDHAREWRSAESPQKKGNPETPPVDLASQVPPTTPHGEDVRDDNLASPSVGIWGDELPSRMWLAKRAYPGLARSADNFRRHIKFIIGLLLLWLILTCLLSWDIAAGQAILARFDAMETARIAYLKSIADKSFDAVVVCDGSPSEAPKPTAVDMTAAQRQLYNDFIDKCRNKGSSREALAQWLASWRLLFASSVDEQRATVLVQVLATFVLPLFYGFLGAGVAVVRNIWSKMRDSLLSPRDPILAWGQMAQGAVVGACIGLFITPSGAGQLVSLTPSALSFIAGFGVEGVFVMLESLIKRVFNAPEQKP